MKRLSMNCPKHPDTPNKECEDCEDVGQIFRDEFMAVYTSLCCQNGDETTIDMYNEAIRNAIDPTVLRELASQNGAMKHFLS